MTAMQTLIPSPFTHIALIAVLIYTAAICIWLIKLLAIDKTVVSPLIFLYPLMVLAIYMEFAVKVVYKYGKYFCILVYHKLRIGRRLLRLYWLYFVRWVYHYLIFVCKVAFAIARFFINLFVR